MVYVSHLLLALTSIMIHQIDLVQFITTCHATLCALIGNQLQIVMISHKYLSTKLNKS